MQIWGYIRSPTWAIHPAPAKPGMQSQTGALPQPRQAITPLKARPFGNFLPPLGVFDCDNCGHCDNRMDIGFACPQFVRSRAKSADKFKCKSGFLHISGHFSRKPVHDRTRLPDFLKIKTGGNCPAPIPSRHLCRPATGNIKPKRTHAGSLRIVQRHRLQVAAAGDGCAYMVGQGVPHLHG